MTIDILSFTSDVAGFDRTEFEYVTDQGIHARRVLADNCQKPFHAFLVFDVVCFQRFNKSQDRGQWCAEFVGNVRKEFLLTRSSRSMRVTSIKTPSAPCGAASVRRDLLLLETIRTIQRYNAQIENKGVPADVFPLSLRFAPYLGAHREGAVNGWIAC